MGIFGITTQTSPSCFNVHSENTPLIPCKTKLYSDSFIPATIRQWNNLPQSARNAQSLKVFKTKLQTQKTRSTTIPEHESTKYFIAACVLGAAHLIMTFIEKKHHKFPVMHLWSSRNPGSLLILHCPNYIVQRHQYFRNLPCPITVNNFVYMGTTDYLQT